MDNENENNQNENERPDYGKEIEALKEQNKQLLSKLEEFTKQKKTEESLNDKARKEQEQRDKASADSKALEAALTFNLKADEFIKANESLLPKEISDIFKIAEKEKYDSAVQKANATKSAIVKAFFDIQSNMDLLTSAHKLGLEEYFRLTKNGREEKAQYVYENIFEPALEMLRRVKKAEELSRARYGLANPSDVDKAYAEKLMKLSRKHYLGEKENA